VLRWLLTSAMVEGCSSADSPQVRVHQNPSHFVMVVASRSGGADRIHSGEHTEIGEYVNQSMGVIAHNKKTKPSAVK